MAFDKRFFVSGRGKFNREAQADVMCVHTYNPPVGDGLTQVIVPGYFNGVVEQLFSGDIIWVNDPNSNPFQLTVDALTPDVSVQVIQVPIISGILTTVGGSATEAFLANLEETSIPQVTMNTTPVGGLTILKSYISGGQLTVEFSADPDAATQINVTITPAII